MTIFFNQLKQHTFPDGMSYREISKNYPRKTEETIVASIRSFTELIELKQLVSQLRVDKLNLVLHYLIGSRMDRVMGDAPNTLKSVCDVINSMKFYNIKTVWSHSQSTNDRLEATSDIVAETLFIQAAFKYFLQVHPQEHIKNCVNNVALCLPDSGAAKRYWNDHHRVLGFSPIIVECGKHRELTTGKLSGFTCPSEVPDHCIIVDDCLDVGGTFCGLATELRKSGAKRVDLAVYHGIFFKGMSLGGIDSIYTTNSFRDDLPSSSNMVVRKVV